MQRLEAGILPATKYMVELLDVWGAASHRMSGDCRDQPGQNVIVLDKGDDIMVIKGTYSRIDSRDAQF